MKLIQTIHSSHSECLFGRLISFRTLRFGHPIVKVYNNPFMCLYLDYFHYTVI